MSSLIRINKEGIGKEPLSMCRAVPSEAVLSGTCNETGAVHYETSDGKVTTGTWQCTPYAEQLICDGFSEFATIISGTVALTTTGGPVEHFGPGDSYVLPVGWHGRFEVLETLRKIYVITVV
ncbi:MAG: DUF861 domain-containing protein [Gammaproteobacteria bacterium]|nr:DUF861 domain-containing protein [Gammaproteobacteria bacterium]